MCKKIRDILQLYICILLSLVSPTMCAKFLHHETDDKYNNALNLINDFRKTYVEAICVTCLCFFIGYLLAGLPKEISWNKILPTLLIAFPVYGTRFASMTWGGNGIGEKMDKVFFKTLYVISITWITWDIFKGII